MNLNVETSHAVIHLSINAIDALTLPVIVELDDVSSPTISLSVAKYARYLQRQGAQSYENITKMVVAIGKLRDFYILARNGISLGPGELIELLEDFLFAIDHGGVLGWRPASNQQYKQIRSAVLEYVQWLVRNSDMPVSASEARFIEACRWSWRSTSNAEKSLLFHTKKRNKKKSAGRRKNIHGLKRYKPFPPRFVQELIDLTKNKRDKLIFALLAYGGRRASELLHQFLEDFKARGEEAHVELRHPELAVVEWTNIAGKRIRGQRREYLMSVFGRLPRTMHGRLASAAGWKGIKFDDGVDTSEMYWIRDAGAYILDLHRDYLYNVRAKQPQRRHPYYFTDENGEPLTMRVLRNQFRLACRRVERKYRVALGGYGPHSLRHFYGFYCADVLKEPLLMIQKYMGHMHPSSTAVYSHISPETAAKSLRDAERRKKGQLPTSEERREITDQFNAAAFQDLNELLGKGATPFGILDTAKLTRRLQ